MKARLNAIVVWRKRERERESEAPHKFIFNNQAKPIFRTYTLFLRRASVSLPLSPPHFHLCARRMKLDFRFRYFT